MSQGKGKVDGILDERQKTHGDFASHAVIAQELKSQIDKSGQELSAVQREGLEMILHKVARILNGNADHKDHWDDIAGYATLVSRDLEREGGK